MLTLMLLRHAKSSWSDAQTADLDRPLSPRGRHAAQAMGRFIVSENLAPDLVLCSPARRARETWKYVAAELKSAPKVIIEETIYDFGNGSRLLDALRKRAGTAKRVMIVGHNPSMERVAVRLATTGDEKLRGRLARKYPTAALAVIGFEASAWDQLPESGGSLERFVRPKDIQADPAD